jgi:hypothetical protein
MTADGGIRASDHDRESTVEVLREAYTAGRLDLDEFDERTTSAYSSKTWGDLRARTDDLPVEPKLGADLQPVTPKPDPVGPARSQSYRPPFIPLLPIALVWLVIAAAAHTSAVVIPIVMLCLISVRLFGWRRRRPSGPKPPQNSLYSANDGEPGNRPRTRGFLRNSPTFALGTLGFIPADCRLNDVAYSDRPPAERVKI